MLRTQSVLQAEEAAEQRGLEDGRGVMLLVAGGRQVARHLREMGKTMLEKKLHPGHTGPHTTR